MRLIDLQEDGSFGKFYGHPEGHDSSKEMVQRLLQEFELNFQDIAELVLGVQVPNGISRIPELQTPFQTQFLNGHWTNQSSYPESNYRADFGLNHNGRWIFAEVELSDIARSVNAFYMERVFRTGYMRLGMFLTPQHSRLENKNFYSRITQRYDYLTPNYPLWVIGFDIDNV